MINDFANGISLAKGPGSLLHPQQKPLANIRPGPRIIGPIWNRRVGCNMLKMIGISNAIRKLDKDTLNMYTLLRTRLGTRELSCIRLDFREMRASEWSKDFRRSGSNE